MNLTALEMFQIANAFSAASDLALNLEELSAKINPRQGSEIQQALRSAALSADSAENMLRIILSQN